MTMTDEWMTPSQAANRLGLSGIRVRQLLSEGRIKHIRTPLGRLVSPSDVERLRAERAAAHQQGERP